MLNDSETYDCEEKGCGRKFETKDGLLSHYQRRHINLYNKYKDIKPNDFSEKTLVENMQTSNTSMLDNSMSLSHSQSLVSTSTERIRIITEELLGVGTKYADIDEIEEVIF
jgi:hypothetical protein